MYSVPRFLHRDAEPGFDQLHGVLRLELWHRLALFLNHLWLTEPPVLLADGLATGDDLALATGVRVTLLNLVGLQDLRVVGEATVG